MLNCVAAVIILGIGGCGEQRADAAQKTNAPADRKSAVVELTNTQLKSISVVPAAERDFPVDRDAVGTIDFNQDMSVQVSSPYQGRIVQLMAKAGDAVVKGQTLFTIESPDLVQAESTLISSAGVLAMTSSALQRAKDLYEAQGLAQKDYEQAVSDQQAAEAAFKAARDAVRIFGKSDAQIDKVVADRQIDARMPVPSPISGHVTARNAAPGLLVQPGGAPPPYVVTDLSSKWMLANVPESDIALIHPGQAVDVRLNAYPGRTFHGQISNIGASLDPNTRRITVRSEIHDPKDELHPQMFATFNVHTGEAVKSVGVPSDGVVREGDGSMTVWVTTDRHRFQPRTVKTGQLRDGQVQILDGLQAGELVAAQGALFISNARDLEAAQ